MHGAIAADVHFAPTQVGEALIVRALENYDLRPGQGELLLLATLRRSPSVRTGRPPWVDAFVEQRDADLRDKMVDGTLTTFIWATGLTLGAIGILATVDEVNIALHLVGPTDRIINAQIIMALLGATTAQVGAIATIIARYLFPGGAR
jgi:hypothetical protein